jgi:hypothetical protein
MPLSRAPSQSLFALDPIKTTLTAPTTDVQVQGTADRSTANRQLSSGLTAFANSLGNLGNLAKERQSTADIKLAEEAAIRGEARPDSDFKEADDAFDNINDANTSWETLRSIKEFENGPEGHALINAQGALSANHNAAHAKYMEFAKTGSDQLGNPILKAKLIEDVKGRLDEVKKLQFGIDQERKQNVATIRVRNQVEELIAGTGSDNPLDEIDLKGSIRSMALEYENLKIGVDRDEAALIVAQMFLLNEDVKSDPEFGTNILEAQFSKDVPFRALLTKGLNPLNDDPHGKAFARIYTKFLTDADREQREAEAQEKDDNKTNKAQALKSVYDQFSDFTTSEGMATALIATGFFEELEALKLAKGRQTFIDTEVKHQKGSPIYLDAVELIKSQKIVLETDVEQLIIDGFLNPSLKSSLMAHVGEEGKQKERFIKSFKDSVGTVVSGALSLAKGTLKNMGALADLIAAPDKDLSQIELLERAYKILQPGITNPDELRRAVNLVQDLRNQINKEAYKRGTSSSILDRENGEVDPLALEQFQTGYVQPRIKTMVEMIEAKLPETKITPDPVEKPMTADDYPLIVNQDEDIFSKDQPGGASNISPSSSATGAVTFSEPDSKSFSSVISENTSIGFPLKATQNEVIDLKALVRDAAVNNFSTPLATMVEDLALKEIERHRKHEDIKEQQSPEGQAKWRRGVAIARKQKNLDDMDKYLGENLRHLPGFLMELLDPTIRNGEKLEPLSKEQIDEIRKKAEESNANKGTSVGEDVADFFSLKGLTNLIGGMLSPGDAESASTGQDSGFKADQAGPRGFDKDNNPIFGTRNELAKGVGELALSKDFTSTVSADSSKINDPKFQGGTSEESDIEGFTGEEVDMPPIVMDEIVVSEKAKPSALSGLPKETQEDIKRQLKNMRTSKIQRDRDAVIKKAELGNIDKIKYGTKPYLSYASWKALGKPARALTSINQLPPSDARSIKSGATIGYGHDILKSELGSGKIHGVSFLNRDGTFKNLTEKQLDIIFQEDIKIAERETNKSYSNKRSQLPNLPKFETLPNTVQIYLTDMGFNIGASKFIKTYPKGLGALEALNMIKTNPNIKPTTNNRLQEIITLSQQSTVGGAISWNNTDMTKNRKRLLEVFKAEITDRGASPEGVKKRAKDLWNSLPIETDLFERFGN